MEKHDGPHAAHFWDVGRSGGSVTMDTTYKDRLMRFKQGLLRPDGAPYEDFVLRLTTINREFVNRIFATL